jgi:glycosyltransferase involved in cell wall biosynthesis
MSKKVLIIAGEFPPIKTIGRLRTVKFVQHLQSFGWTPIVLTLATTPDTYDSSLENEIPENVEIYRINKPDIEKSIVSFIKNSLRTCSRPLRAAVSCVRTERRNRSLQSVNEDFEHRLSANHSGAVDIEQVQRKTPKPPTVSNQKTSQSQIRPPEKEQDTSLKSRMISLFKDFLKYVVYTPDDFNLWAFKACKQAEDICNKHNINLVYTTLPPFSSCFVGYKIKSKYNIPWVIDYRDLWYGDVLREWIPKYRQTIELMLEKRFLKKADAIITVSEQKTSFLKKLHPSVTADWLTITNGYDSDIFEPLLKNLSPKDDVIDFVYTGRLFKNRRGYAFAEALGQICQKSPDLKNKVKVHILGGVAPEIQERYNQILEQYGIKDIYNFTGDISYQAAMSAQVNADYLLLIVDTGATSDGVIPGKLFEYIASRRPIFALTNPGATQDIIEKSRTGIVVPAESIEQCKTELEKLLQKPIPGPLQPNSEYLEQFDRKNLSARLAKLFDQLTA